MRIGAEHSHDKDSGMINTQISYLELSKVNVETIYQVKESYL